ncbi:MAG: AmmeMemoRadiSam system protein B [Candidatus Omnitrophota bacterium]
MVREPAVAGQFYPGGRESLIKTLDNMILPIKNKVDAICAVVPHAGYSCSGIVAGEVYAKIMPKETYIILGPNHTGYGSPFSASSESWHTPLANVDVDRELLDMVMENAPMVKIDPSAHVFEHSIEVQLPFIQRISPEAKIVPITVGYGDLKDLKKIGDAISDAADKSGKKIMVLASSDMSHYLPRKTARAKDMMAIEKILALDPEGLLNVVEENDISMCGYIPAVIMLFSARKMKASGAELVRYGDSGDLTGDTGQVVGYAGVIVFK